MGDYENKTRKIKKHGAKSHYLSKALDPSSQWMTFEEAIEGWRKTVK